jgi:hypothetical protein
MLVYFALKDNNSSLAYKPPGSLTPVEKRKVEMESEL